MIKNKLRTKKIIFTVLMFLPIAVSMIAIPFMPENIPMHFDFNGNIDRLGSRWETLIVAASTIEIGIVFIAANIISGEKEKGGSNNQKALYSIGTSLLAVFNILFAFFLLIVFKEEKSIALSRHIPQIVIGLVGTAFVVIGNVMPTLRRNSIVGFRLPSTMKSDDVWKKSQHFAGICGIVAGILMIITAILTKGSLCVILGVALMMIYILICCIYSVRIHDSDEQ